MRGGGVRGGDTGRGWRTECSREGFGLEGVAGAPGVREFADGGCGTALVI
jgi:hypothetical protein